MNKLMKPLAILVLVALLLCGCGETSVFGVSTEEDNTIHVTAVKADKGSHGLGYLTVGENEVLVVEADFENKGKLRVRMFEGLLDSDEFNEDFISETIVSEHDTATVTTAPGEYTVDVSADGVLTGTAAIYVKSTEKTTD